MNRQFFGALTGRNSGRRSQRNLASQIQRASFWLTMLVVLCLGGSMLAVSVSEVLQSQRKANHAAANVVGQILTADIQNQIDNLRDLAANPITWTSFTDITGRDAYLQPSLVARENHARFTPTALFDYQGEHIAGALPAAPELQPLQELVQAVVSGQQLQIALLPQPQVKLLVATPVIYPYTTNMVGVLTSEIDLHGLFLRHTAQKQATIAVDIRSADHVLLSTASASHSAYLPARFDLPWALNPTSSGLSVWLYSTQNPWWQPVARLLGIALLIAALLSTVVWQVSRRLARRTAARIEQLAAECDAITAGQASQVTPDFSPDEIGVLSRTLAQALAAYHHINQNLETVVEQKTRALLESESHFRGFFEHNTSVMLQIDPHTGQVMLANQAAADFYGYSLDALMAMHITDLNCLAPEETQVQMALAEHENRHSFIFQHRLRSGEVRDVEVYSTPMHTNQKAVLFSVIHDITERLATERKLKINDQALMSISQGVVVTNAHAEVVSMNRAFSDITGYRLEDVLGQPCKFLQGPCTDADTVHAIRQAQQAGRAFDGEVLNYRKNGEAFWNAMTITQMFDDNGQVSHYIGIVRDITERKQAKERLQLAANVFTFASEGIMITNADGIIVDTNAAFSLITGYAQEEVVGQKPHLLGSGRQDGAFFTALWAELRSSGQWHGEIWNRRKNGEFYAAMLNVSAVRNSKNHIDYFVALYTDITAKKNYQHQLERRAYHDPLTGLANRVLLTDRLDQAMAHALRHHQQLALVYLDLDGFKAVNDAHGHQGGDLLLITLAERMQAVLREGDTLARVGGDEFVAVLVDLASNAESGPVLERMLRAASTPVLIEAAPVQVSASVGVTYFPQNCPTSAEQLLEQADQAMYQAKQSGKNRIQIFGAPPPEESTRAANLVAC